MKVKVKKVKDRKVKDRKVKDRKVNMKTGGQNRPIPQAV